MLFNKQIASVQIATLLTTLLLMPGPAIAQDARPDLTELRPINVDSVRTVIPAPSEAMTLLPPANGGQVATGSQLGILGNRASLVTPFNVTAYTSKFVDDTQSRSVADVAAADPSVRTIFPISSYRDVYSIRGFNLFSYNMGMDGLYGIAPKQRYPAYFAERVEILKGPDTFVNGISLGGSVGGAINIIPKRATDEPVATFTTSYESSGDVGTRVDVGRRYGADKALGIRFNGAVEGGKLAVEDQSQRLGAAALSLDYQGDRFRLYGDFGYQEQKVDAPDWAATLASGSMSIPVPSSTVSLSQSWANLKTRDNYGLVRGEYDLSSHWTAFAAYGISSTETSGIYVQPTNIRANGDYTGVINSFPSNSLHKSTQAGVRGTFTTGPVHHNVTFAVARWDQYLKAEATSLGSFSSNLFNPLSIVEPDTSKVVDLDQIHRTSVNHFTSFVAADTTGLFSERLQLIWGGRWQKVQNESFGAATGLQSASYDASKFSPALGAVLRVTQHVSLYGNYVEALQQGPSAPETAANFGAVFAPIVSRQIETGVKVNWGNWFSSLSAFQIMQPSGVTNPSTLVYSIEGQQRNRGVEFNMSGEPLHHLRVLGGAMLLDARQTDTGGAKYDGNKAIGTPGYQINLGAEWDVLFIPALTVTGRVILTGAQFVDAANMQQIDPWTRIDLGARYVWRFEQHKPVTLRFSIENLLNRRYWASASIGQVSGISRGGPRILLVSSTFQF